MIKKIKLRKILSDSLGSKVDIGSGRIFEAYSFYVLMTISFAVLIFSVFLHQKGKFVHL